MEELRWEMVTFGPKLQKAVSTFIRGSGIGLPSEAPDSHLLCVFPDIIQPLNLKGFRYARSQTEIYSASMNPRPQSQIELSTLVRDQNQMLPSRGSPSWTGARWVTGHLQECLGFISTSHSRWMEAPNTKQCQRYTISVQLIHFSTSTSKEVSRGRALTHRNNSVVEGWGFLLKVFMNLRLKTAYIIGLGLMLGTKVVYALL